MTSRAGKIKLGIAPEPENRMRLMIACCALALLTGCGKEADLADGAGLVAEAAAPAGDSVAPGPCTLGVTLPLTGLCAEPSRGQFLAMDANATIFGDACVWTTAEVAMSSTEALVFRTQDCSAQGWPVLTYSFANNKLITHLSTGVAGVEPITGQALEVFKLGAGQTAEKVALQTLVGAQADERSQCITSAMQGATVAGKAFELAPNEELTARLNAENAGEAYSACGPYGYTDAAQFWEARPGRALFHTIGQDDPSWDPMSFTFYRKGPGGTWGKTN